MACISNLQSNDKQQNFDDLLQDILEMTMEVLGVDAGAIRLYDEKKRELVLRAHKGLSEESLVSLKRRRYGEGLSWKCVRLNVPTIIKTNDLEMYIRHPSGYAFIVPLLCNRRLIGTIIILYKEPPGKLERMERRLFSLIGNQIGVALENARLADEFRKRNTALETLEHLSKAVNKLHLDQILNNATDRIMQLFGCRFVYIRTIDTRTGEFVYTGHKGLTAEELERMPKRYLRDGGFIMSAINSKEVSIVHDLTTEAFSYEKRQKFLKSTGCRGLVIIPLSAREKILGVMYIGYSMPYTASKDDINLYTAIGELMGTAIDNAVIYIEKLDEIAERNRAEKELNIYREHLEKLVAERTAELGKKNRDLEELSTALKVLLRKREEDRKHMEESLVFNIRHLLNPLLEEMKREQPNGRNRFLVNIMESRLNEILSPLVTNMKQFNLTPKEILVAAMVKDGKTSKAIAEIIGVEASSIDSHRNSIRKKLGLNKRANLQSKLRSM